MKIIIDLLSYTLIGSGEGIGIIDSDVVLDELGFPYIPSKRIKGVLKESAEEICDILGINDYKIVESIFGKDGFTEGKLHIGNLYINNYKRIKEEIKNLKNYKNSIYKGLVNSSKITSYYTAIRQQTSIEEDSGIAREGSLRTFRVLKPGLKFEGELNEIKSLTKKEEALLYLAAINLKRIGTSRNRGFGEIKCLIDDIEIQNLSEAMQYLNSSEDIKEEKVQPADIKLNKKDYVKKLSYKITALSPILIAKEIGEQNTVYTEKYIPSTTVRGLFANKFIKELNLDKTAHEDDNFYNLFLKGKIIFTPAYTSKNNKIYYPALYFHKEKGKDSNSVYNILEEVPNDIKTKPLNRMIYYIDDKIYTYDISTTFYFHNTRDREKGHSTGEDIYYYESINEGEEFKGFIIGDEGYLEGIKKLFNEKFTSFIGRSKSAQYGLVKIEFGDLEDVDKLDDEDKEFIIVAISSIILHNDWGFSEISEKILNNYLKKYFYDCDIIVEKIIARTEYIENFVGIWGMKNTRELAYSLGSAFKIKVEGCDNLEEKLNNLLIYGFGERTDLGFGRVKIYWYLNKKYNVAKEEDEFKDITPEMSKSIIFGIVNNEIEEEIRMKAFEKAKEFSDKKHTLNISNNLIGRLEGMLFDIKSFDDWRTKLSNLYKKPAGETLKNINLWDELYELDIFNEYKNMFYDKLSTAIKDLSLNLNHFELSKTYWISFFRYLRLFKKQEGKKNE
jgi:CRISPR-associated protein Csx10